MPCKQQSDIPTSMGIPFFLCFFFSHAQDRPFLTKQNNTAKTSAIPIFNARDALGRTPLESARAYASSGRDTPRSSRRALTPRCPPTRQKRRGRGFGCGGGGRLGDLPEPAGARRRRRRHRRRRRRSRRCRVDGRVVDACGGGCLFVYNTKINHHVCLKFFKLLSSPGIRATHDGLLRAPLTTLVARGREVGGGEDDPRLFPASL